MLTSAALPARSLCLADPELAQVQAVPHSRGGRRRGMAVATGYRRPEHQAEHMGDTRNQSAEVDLVGGASIDSGYGEERKEWRYRGLSWWREVEEQGDGRRRLLGRRGAKGKATRWLGGTTQGRRRPHPKYFSTRTKEIPLPVPATWVDPTSWCELEQGTPIIRTLAAGTSPK